MSKATAAAQLALKDDSHKVSWQAQEGPQSLFIRCPAFECLYGGAIGGGKFLSDATKVITPFGYRDHGDLQVGDTICAADGTPTKVVLVTARTVRPMYRVTFDDGSEVVAGDEHLWNYSVMGHPWRKSGRLWKTATTVQLLEMMDSGRKIAIPLCDPVKFTKSYKPSGNPRKIDSYTLGVLLGDGNITGGNVRFSSVDEHIANRVRKHYPTDGWVESKTEGRSALSYDARGDTRTRLIGALEGLGIYGELAHEKHVPDPYMWLCVAERYTLIQGLMDTDGYIDERGQAYFTSTSQQLAMDVRWLVFSLGGRARITSKIPTYTHNGEKLDGRKAYTVTIRMPDNRRIVSLPRKKDRANAWRENGNGELKRRIKSIEYVGDEECHCIAVDHPDSLYLVDEFVVTHNTDALLGDFAAGMNIGSAWRGVYIRRFFPDMDDVIHRSMEIFGPVYGEKCYSASRHQWNFPNGSVLQFRALEKDMDVYKFQGQQYAWIGWDELTQWPSPFPYTYLMTRLRSAKGAQVRVRAASNPGGAGHHWVKARFIDPSPPGVGRKIHTKSGDSYYRVFIPSKLEDNKILMENDPGYADRIYEVSDPALANALREGRWDIVAGAAIPEWDPLIHVIDPAPIPTDKPVWRSMDWGYATPYGCLWMFPDHDGNVIVGSELYGWSGTPNVGTQEAPGEVRKKIESFESLHEVYVPMGLLDSQCWETIGKNSLVADELGGRSLGWRPWPKGSHSRVQQKQLLHSYLAITNGRSRLKIMRNCKHLIRTLPILPRDKANIEDVDTNAEDHLYDALRAGLTKKTPTRNQIRERARRRRMEATGFISPGELSGGGW